MQLLYFTRINHSETSKFKNNKDEESNKLLDVYGQVFSDKMGTTE